MTKLLVIVGGPTASGKTRLAIDLATHFKSPIVSADSRQIYKELTIGTAKPTPEELAEASHYFINSHAVTENINAGNYAMMARELLFKLFTENDVVILAGGSGLYIDALVNGIDDLPEANQEIRNELKQLFDEEGLVALQNLLKEKDPESFKQIDIYNPRRIIRALEVTLSQGTPYSSLLGLQNEKLPWKIIMVGIDWNREKLYERINLRTSQMIQQGLKEEALSVIAHRKQNALMTVGYKEMFQHLDGNITIEETEALIAKNTRNYAKRQLTWFRRYKEMIWIQPGEISKLIDLIEKSKEN